MARKTNSENVDIKDLQEQINKLKIKVNNIETQIDKNNVKKKKDPNAPKRNLTSFMFFNKENIEKYKKDNPNEKIYVTKIVKKSGEQWKSLKDNEKDKYIKMATKDKKRYEKEISTYKKI
jgi:TolA-binding protein